MQGNRTLRVAHRIREVLMELLLHGEVRDPRVASAGMLTVTRVEVSGDLAHAKIYFVVHGAGAKQVEAGLMAARGHLRREVSVALGARVAPELRFFVDEQYERSESLRRLLDQIGAEDSATEKNPGSRG